MAINSPFGQLLDVMSGDPGTITAPKWTAAQSLAPAATKPVSAGPKDQPTVPQQGQSAADLLAQLQTGQGGGGDLGTGSAESGHDFGGSRGPGPGARGTGVGASIADAVVGGIIGGVAPFGGVAINVARALVDPNFDPRSLIPGYDLLSALGLFGGGSTVSPNDPGLFGPTGALTSVDTATTMGITSPSSLSATSGLSTAPGSGSDPGVGLGGGADPGGGTSGTAGGEHGTEKGAATGTDASGFGGSGGSGLGSGTGGGSGNTGEGLGVGSGGTGQGGEGDAAGNYGRGGKIKGGGGPGRKVKINAHEGEGVLTKKSMSLIGEKTLETINTIAESSKPNHAKLLAIREAFQKMRKAA